ncbi:MAG: hypothetical protein ACTSQ4_02275 [Candidatus Heimdallarchaeaceae archaeon]
MKHRKQDDKYFNKLNKPKYPPVCQECGKPMKNGIDSITKKISPYIWETTCEHFKRQRLSIG